MCGFIAQFVEHCTGIVEVTGLNPVEAHIFLGSFFSITQIEKCTVLMITLHIHVQSQDIYMKYFIYPSHHFTAWEKYILDKLTSLTS